ncbi:surface carbohydrate biosynthesis protein [Dongia sp.]|uniref:surface carbohydrate biosynthesis protein n=1 Tax=Dongia sp. TaxID=1977262 RepID=UPI0035B3AC2E
MTQIGSTMRDRPENAAKLKRILYLPMEIASRELDSRLLLAALALKRGFEVILGQKWLIERNIDAMPAGIYLSKTLTQRDAKSLRQAKDRGYLVAAIDEEMPGLVTSPDELRWISDDAVAATDRIFISGDHNTSSVRTRFPQSADRVISALNPRWDLLRPGLRHFYEQEAAEIRERFGSFILINTNLGFTNSEKGSAEEIIGEQERLGKLSMANPKHVAYVNGILAMEAANREVIVKLIDELPKRFPDRRIVLRPHPSERLDTWRTQVDGHAVVDVIREGPAIPWILAADVLVHTNCTTGVEAAALDTPAICVLPTETTINDRYLSNRVNPVAHNVAETLDLIDVAETLHAGARFFSDDMRQAFRRSMSYDDNMLGAEHVLAELEQAVVDAGMRLNEPARRCQWRPRHGYAWTLEDKNVRGALFPGLDREFVVKRIASIARTLGIELATQVHECGSKVMLLSAHQMPLDVRMRRFFCMTRTA